MNPHKKQVLERQIIEQSNSQILDLNDLVLGYEGARIVSALLPEYHKNLKHIRINGNNIDSQGFQLILSALFHCPNLKSIQAQWNNIGSSEVGLAALCGLVNSLSNLQLIDLKNNRISHYLAQYIAEIIQMNRRNLKVVDLRWNEIGELGAKQILAVLPFNKNIKFIGLEDNRISTGTLMEIESILKTGGYANERVLKHSHSLPTNTIGAQYFPISMDEYASMDVQLKTGEIRSKIDNEQKQADRYVQRIEVEIQKVLQKIKLKGAQSSELQLKYDSILSENARITEQLREAERALALEKQRSLGVETQYNSQKSDIRNEKYKLNNSIQNVMQKFTQRNQRQLQEIDLAMNQKLDRLNSFLKERLFEKRTNRDKLSELKQDILKLSVGKEDISNKAISSHNLLTNKSIWDEQVFALQEQIAKAKTTLQNEIKKGQYLSKQLNSQTVKALNKEQSLQKQIFEAQNKIKTIHHGMALKNLELEENMAEVRLKESEIYDKEASIGMQTSYLKYLQSQSNIKVEIESMMQQEITKGGHISDEGIENRIVEIERALRAQQAQNRMIKNQYEKLLGQLENVAKRSIQTVLFE